MPPRDICFLFWHSFLRGCCQVAHWNWSGNCLFNFLWSASNLPTSNAANTSSQPPILPENDQHCILCNQGCQYSQPQSYAQACHWTLQEKPGQFVPQNCGKISIATWLILIILMITPEHQDWAYKSYMWCLASRKSRCVLYCNRPLDRRAVTRSLGRSQCITGFYTDEHCPWQY